MFSDAHILTAVKALVLNPNSDTMAIIDRHEWKMMPPPHIISHWQNVKLFGWGGRGENHCPDSANDSLFPKVQIQVATSFLRSSLCAFLSFTFLSWTLFILHFKNQFTPFYFVYNGKKVLAYALKTDTCRIISVCMLCGAMPKTSRQSTMLGKCLQKYHIISAQPKKIQVGLQHWSWWMNGVCNTMSESCRAW